MGLKRKRCAAALCFFFFTFSILLLSRFLLLAGDLGGFLCPSESRRNTIEEASHVQVSSLGIITRTHPTSGILSLFYPQRRTLKRRVWWCIPRLRRRVRWDPLRRSTDVHRVQRRRRLRRWGPGSFPPGCVSKCGKCTPCRAVHVPVSPRRPVVVVAEYYPETWRCKCRNRLYSP